jgi:hypothetical protein
MKIDMQKNTSLTESMVLRNFPRSPVLIIDSFNNSKGQACKVTSITWIIARHASGFRSPNNRVNASMIGTEYDCS